MMLGGRSFSIMIDSFPDVLGMGGNGEEVKDCTREEMIVTEGIFFCICDVFVVAAGEFSHCSDFLEIINDEPFPFRVVFTPVSDIGIYFVLFFSNFYAPAVVVENSLDHFKLAPVWVTFPIFEKDPET